MVFSSMEFMFRFLPVFLIAYFLTKPPYRNATLIAGSLIFYAYGEPIYIFLMVFSILVNYKLTQNIKKYYTEEAKTGVERRIQRKSLLIIAMVFNFGTLFFFKYLNFFIEIVNNMSNSKLHGITITMPLGISFYTFQMAAYVIDVYRGDYEGDDDLMAFAAYVCMFPQLIAGPIVNYREVKEKLHKRKVNLKEIEWGTSLFIMGLTYKVLLANKIASLWNDVQTVGVFGINTPTAWLGSWGFSMQLFFDFFGYSLMAIGLGHIMGFKFPTNFNNPYVSVSATEFWRRWHITLSRWFRDYVYIPLGGNRVGKGRLVFNTFIVWFLTGLWHGASWNFIIWGLFFFVLLMLEKNFYLDKLEKNRILGHIYMLIVIPVSWTIFNITDLSKLGLYLKRMFFIPIKGSVVINGMDYFGMLFGRYWWLLLICAFCCTPIPYKMIKKTYKNPITKVILFALLWLSVYQIAQGGNNPFLYFRF